jgi:gluconolactonase
MLVPKSEDLVPDRALCRFSNLVRDAQSSWDTRLLANLRNRPSTDQEHMKNCLPAERVTGRSIRYWIFALVTLLGATITHAAPAFKWRQEKDSVALLTSGGETVWQFNYGQQQRTPYFHPVGLAGEAPLTWFAPPDHVWHYGLWFAWKYLNGRNYWEFDPKTGHQDGLTKWSNVRVQTRDDFSARIELDLVYHPHDNPVPVLRERRIIEASAPGEDGAYSLDWSMLFTALNEPVKFQRTPIPGEPNGVSWGGYAGLSWRFAKDLRDWQVVNADGVRGMEGHGRKSVGCDFSGTINGREMGVAMLDHPQSLHAPTPWFLVMAPEVPFSCLIAAPIYDKDAHLEAGQSFNLRYRLALHRGRWDAERLKSERQRYLKAAPETTAASQATDSLIAPGAKLEKLSGEFKFTEGPTADAKGNVFFTDQPNDRIMKWSIDGQLSTFMQPAGRANGMYFDADGNLIACADEKNELWSIAPDGKVTVLVSTYDGKPLNGPNDVWVRPQGGLYFTDPFYKRPWWTHTQMPQDGQHVYFLPPGKKNLVRVADDLRQPNGIIGTPDGQTLFVADIGARRTYSYRIQPDGTLTDKRLFCELGSDGMTLDTEGNLYLTGKGVIVFDKMGRQIKQIPVPEPWTANVSFGGPERQTLFITASAGLYSIELQTRGANISK